MKIPSLLMTVMLVGCVSEPEPIPDAGTTLTCPVATGPTMHSGPVKTDTTWTAAGSPHVVTSNVDIIDGATLRIEPCAEVLLAEDAHLRVAYPPTPNTGTLIAEGTAQKPIVFRGVAGARWASLFVHAPGIARLAYVTIEGGGSERFEEGASINVKSGEIGDALLFVDHVTVRKSLGAGVRFDGRAAFISGSRELIITESGNSDWPYPLIISEHALDGVPTGSFTGNFTDEILLIPVGTSTAGEGLTRDATVRERGVPYHVGRGATDNLRIGGAQGTVTTLSFEPGVVMKFEPETGLFVQKATNDQPSTAVIRALGTAEKPVVFTSAAVNPKAGDWRGVWFGGIPQAANKLDHVRIEYAGAWCGCQLLTCSDVTSFNGAVIFTQQPQSAFITNSTFVDITGHGVTQGYDGAFVDFRPGNTFDNVSGCAQTRPREAVCGNPRPLCD